METLRVVPVHPSEGRQLEVFDRLRRPRLARFADEFGLVVASDHLGQGIVIRVTTVPIDGATPISPRRSRCPSRSARNVRSVTQSRSGAAAVNPHSGTRPYQTPDESARLLAPTRLSHHPVMRRARGHQGR